MLNNDERQKNIVKIQEATEPDCGGSCFLSVR